MSTNMIEGANIDCTKPDTLSFPKIDMNPWLAKTAGFAYLIAMLGVFDFAIFSGVPWSFLMIFGFPIALLCMWFGKMMKELASPQFTSKSVIKKLIWFLTSQYFLCLGMIGILMTIGGTMAGFSATTGAANVKDKLTNMMPGLWAGIRMMAAISTLVFAFFLFMMPYSNYRCRGSGKNAKPVRVYDNLHAMGIMFNTCQIAIFFLIYFIVEFTTKFVVQ